MTRNEILTDLAMKHYRKILAQLETGFIWYKGAQFRGYEYQNRRAELINEPDDSDLPRWVQWKAQDEDGRWYFFVKKPSIDGHSWFSNHSSFFASLGTTPAGHDWKKTLKKVNFTEKSL